MKQRLANSILETTYLLKLMVSLVKPPNGQCDDSILPDEGPTGAEKRRGDQRERK